MSVLFQDFFSAADGTLITAHSPDVPGSGVYTWGGTAPTPSITSNRCKASAVAGALTGIARFGPITDAELDARIYADVERISASGGLAMPFTLRKSGTNHEALELYLDFPDGTQVTIRAVRRLSGGGVSDNVAIATLGFASGAQLRFGMDVIGTAATFWTEPYGGGARTVQGTHTFSLGYQDSSHRHVGFITSVASGSADIAWIDSFTLQRIIDAPIAGTTNSIAIHGLPAPPERYDRQNEAQFRRQIERILLEIVQYNERLIADPASVTLHEIASTSGVGARHAVSGLTIGQVLRAFTSENVKFQRLSAADIDPGTFPTGGPYGFQTLVAFKDVELDDQDATPVADRRLRAIDGFVRATDTANVEGRHISRLSVQQLTSAELPSDTVYAAQRDEDFRVSRVRSVAERVVLFQNYG